MLCYLKQSRIVFVMLRLRIFAFQIVYPLGTESSAFFREQFIVNPRKKILRRVREVYPRQVRYFFSKPKRQNDDHAIASHASRDLFFISRWKRRDNKALAVVSKPLQDYFILRIPH